MADIRDKMEEMAKKAVKLRDKDGLAWHDVAGSLDTSVGKAMLAYNFGKVTPSERVTAKNDQELAKKIVSLRDREQVSWGIISARTGRGEAQCRALYESVKGVGSTRGNRIGKGGRFPGGTTAKKAPAKKVVAKKTVAKKAPVKKAASSGRPAAKKAGGARKAPAKKAAKAGSRGGSAPNTNHPLVGLDYSDLAEKLEGRTITVVREGRKDEHIKVKTVKALNGEEATLIDTDAKTRTVRVREIQRMSRAA